MQLLLGSKPEAVHSVGPAVGPLAKLLGCPGEAHAGHHRAVDDCLYGATEPISVYLFSARVALLSQSILTGAARPFFQECGYKVNLLYHVQICSNGMGLRLQLRLLPPFSSRLRKV